MKKFNSRQEMVQTLAERFHEEYETLDVNTDIKSLDSRVTYAPASIAKTIHSLPESINAWVINGIAYAPAN